MPGAALLFTCYNQFSEAHPRKTEERYGIGQIRLL
nr:MAG TPA_asm: hypothetical protein [Caudoviricetes sp.]